MTRCQCGCMLPITSPRSSVGLASGGRSRRLAGRYDTLGKLLEVGFQSELQYRAAKTQTVEA
jgi:hypothetical protein